MAVQVVARAARRFDGEAALRRAGGADRRRRGRGDQRWRRVPVDFVDAQPIWAAANLARVALACHVAPAVGRERAVDDVVVTVCNAWILDKYRNSFDER